VLSITLPAFFLIIGDANMYQRFFSARDAGSAKKSAVWMFVGVAVVDCAIILTALLGSALVAQGKLAAPENPGHIVVAIAFDVLPPLLGAMLVGTIVAIVVSTADSFLLAPTTSLVRDVYQRFLRPDASQRDIVRVSRIVVLVLGLLAFGLAFSSDEFFNVALFAYTIYGVGITPVMLAAFFWKRANSAGAVASMVTGVAVAIAWKNDMFGLATSINTSLGASLEPILVALPMSLVALVFVSLMTAPPTRVQSEAI
jgi:SSS family solute:Na+ symporter